MTPIYQSKAFLIRKYRFSETSFILLWLTQKHGKVRTVAQGALKREGIFSGKWDLFLETEIFFLLNKKSDLHSLKEVLPLQREQTLKPGYLTLLTASYFAQLCDLFIEPLEPVPELFDLLARALGFLSKHHPTSLAVEHFEKELAKVLGIYDASSSRVDWFHRTGTLLPPSRKKLLEQLSLHH